MQTFHDYSAAVTTYAAAALAFLFSNSGTIMQLLGFVLVVARLVQEVPAAYRVIKRWWKGEPRVSRTGD